MSNKSAYEAADVVERFSRQNELQKPEETVLCMFAKKLATMRIAVRGDRLLGKHDKGVQEKVRKGWGIRFISGV